MSNSGGDRVRSVAPDTVQAVIRRMEQDFDRGSERIVNCPAALDRLDGDVELFADLLAYYFADGPSFLTAIDDAVSAGNADAVHRSAHRLKGMLANFDARQAILAAAELETMGRDNALAGARDANHRLHHEVQRVTALLESFCRPEGR